LKDNELKKKDDDILKLKNQKNKLLKQIPNPNQQPNKLTLNDLIPTKDNNAASESD